MPRRLPFVVLLLPLALLLALAWRPAAHLWQTYHREVGTPQPLPPGQATDLSPYSRVPVAQQIDVAPDTAAALRQLRQLLAVARARHLPVAIAGAQHSQGGHSLAWQGLRLNMLPFNYLQLDTASQVLTVGSGARWAEVIPYLNRYGRAVGTMQSDNAFSVGGSLSVNCHGWQPNQPPIAATVLSLRLLLADGRLLTCSRRQQPELFGLVLGGYGLLGIILDARLRTVPNAVYAYRRATGPAADYLTLYHRHVDNNPAAGLAYGRLSTTRNHFLEAASLNYFERVGPAPAAPLPAPGLTALKRTIFLGSKRNAYGKQLRWQAEQAFACTQVGRTFTRNEVMNQNPALYLNRRAGQTDVLHEYFIPRRGFEAFRQALRRHVPAHPQADLLNVTLRNVYADSVTYLPYAREEVFGFVLFFNQALTPAAEADMAALTRELVAAAHRCGGTYYLPYRPHPTPTQLRQAYPQFDAFVARKRAYDPQQLFQNQFYRHYAPVPGTGGEWPAPRPAALTAR